MQPAAHLQRFLAVLLHQKHGLGFRRDQLLKARLRLPRQRQVAAVHQVAGRRVAGQDVGHGAGRLVQAVEQQQSHPAVRRQRLGAQRGLGNQGQRPFRADQQPRHVDVSVAEHVDEVVSAVVLRTVGLIAADQFGLFRQQRGQPVDEFPLPRNGAGAPAVGRAVRGPTRAPVRRPTPPGDSARGGGSSRTSASGCRRRRWPTCFPWWSRRWWRGRARTGGPARATAR